MTNVAFNSATPSLVSFLPSLQHVAPAPASNDDGRYKIITIDGIHYIVDSITQDLSPMWGDTVATPVTPSTENDGRYTLVRDGSKVFTVDTLTGEIVRTLHLEGRKFQVTNVQLNDPKAKALVEGTLEKKPTRAKRKVINPHGRELMTYKLNNQERFFMLLKAVAVTDSTLIAKSGKLNFSFRDLGRILCMDEFTSDHLFSDSRGNEYTMAAYRKVIGRFVKVCRQAWEGKALSPDYDQIP